MFAYIYFYDSVIAGKDDTSKPEQRFKAWAKNLCTRQALSKPWDMKILQVFFNIRGEILVFFKKNVEFLEFLAFTLHFRRFQAKKKFFFKFFF